MSKRKIEVEETGNKKQKQDPKILPKPLNPENEITIKDSDSEEESEQKIFTEQELKSMDLSQLKEICISLSISTRGRKPALIKNIIYSQKKVDEEDNQPKSTDFKDEVEVLKKFVELNVTGRISRCLIAGILHNYVSFTGKNPLQNLVCKVPCYSCNEEISVTILNVALQPDKGTNYQNDGIECIKCKSKNFISNICTGEFSSCEPKRHYHCEFCPHLGKCQTDYREIHCYGCGSHYWGGNGSIGCSCSFFGRTTSRRSRKRDCSIM